MASIATQHCWMRAERDSRIEIRVERQPSLRDSGVVKLDLDVSVGFTGQFALSGTPNESVAGWKIGFVQLKHTTTDWAEYRGLLTNDGSIFAALDRPPARIQQLCLDCPPTHRPFYGDDFSVTRPDRESRTDSTVVLAPGVALPPGRLLEVVVTLGDAPSRQFEIALSNTEFTPPRINYLHSLESRAAFVTLLTAKDPQSRYHYIKHMYWNVIWQAHFRWDSRTQRLEKTGQSGGVHIQRQAHSGIPNDPRFASSLRGAPAALPLCNTIAQAAYRHPGRLRYARQWQMWRVGR